MPAERLTEPALENVPRVPSRDSEGIAQVIDGAEKGWLWRRQQAAFSCWCTSASGTGPEVRADKHSWSSGDSDFILRPTQHH